MKADDIDLVLIDGSGGGDVNGKCRESAKAYPDIPLVALLAQDAPSSPQCRLETCNNVLRFPFAIPELVARIQLLIACDKWPALQVGELSLDIKARCVRRGESVSRLTPKQAKLLQVFMCYPERTLTRKFLMETIWDTDYMGDTRTLDVHVRWLRERIEKDPGAPQYLRTVRGVGYRFGIPPRPVYEDD
ncbi:MAG: response regulator transcription factor [Anaerolineae bacterium]|nr:response regulator transcription factor [Anaerolineae bacterium]